MSKIKNFRIVGIEYPDGDTSYGILEHCMITTHKRHGFLFLKRRKVKRKEWKFIKSYDVDSFYMPILFESKKLARKWILKYKIHK